MSSPPPPPPPPRALSRARLRVLRAALAVVATAALAPALGGCVARTANEEPRLDAAFDAAAHEQSALAAVAFAEAQVGRPYCWGGTGPRCFDCSGLVQAAWRAAGMRVPRTADEQRDRLEPVSLDELEPGDILYWHGHVGMYVGDGEMVDALNARAGVVRRPLPRRAPPRMALRPR